MEGITKIYHNGFVANNRVDFSVRYGEIHALAGENGAGKSTLMKILFGEEVPQEGRILYQGEEVRISSPLAAIEMGIGMVHQHFMLVPSLTVAENIVLGMEPQRFGLLDIKKAATMTRQVAEKYGLPIDPYARVEDLSVGLKQRVEMLKVLIRGAQVLILDEPTAVLTPQETVDIFRELQTLRDMGHTIIFITHKLSEIKQICDRITIIRDGQTIAVRDVEGISEQEISKLMVGRDVSLDIQKRKAEAGEVILRLEDASYYDVAGRQLLKDISLVIKGGEILGIAGIEGNGQNELAELICGMRSLKQGRIEINGTSVQGKSIRDIREMGVSTVSQDRMTYGVAVEADITSNIMSNRYYKKAYNKGPFLDGKKMRAESARLVSEYSIKCDGIETPVKMLSGGNMQKVVVAREFSSEPSLIVANQPTRGIDVGAAELVRNRLIRLRDDGAAVLLISADLMEVLSLSDRLVVFYNGAITAYFESLDGLTPEETGEYMLGLKQMELRQIRGDILEQQTH